MNRRFAALLAVTGLALGAAPVRAQPVPDPPLPIEDQVAQVLFERGMLLYGRGDVENARQLFIEAYEKNPQGPAAGDAEKMVMTCNERLGVADLRTGLPGHEPAEPIPVKPVDPYAGTIAEGKTPVIRDPNSEPGVDLSRWGFLGWSGGLGLVTGLAVGGPSDDAGDFRGVAAATGAVGLAGFGALAYWLDPKYDLNEAQRAAIASAGTWGTVSFALLGDVITGRESSTGDVFKVMALGGFFGTSLGVIYAAKGEPRVGDIAFTNSLAGYGTAAALLLGVAISPPRDEAYSLNAFFGSLAGVTTGMLLRHHVELSRRRTLWLDLGAGAGAAAAWVAIYPFFAKSGSNDDEQLAAGLSIGTMAAGVATAWWLTRDLDADGDDDAELGHALLWRSREGRWSLGTPSFLPMTTSPYSGDVGLGLTAAAGTF